MDYSLFGYIWKGMFYFDTVLAMGHSIAPYVCQRVTSAIRHIHCKLGFYLLNFVDDFLGVEHRDIAQRAYDRLDYLRTKIRQWVPRKLLNSLVLPLMQLMAPWRSLHIDWSICQNLLIVGWRETGLYVGTWSH